MKIASKTWGWGVALLLFAASAQAQEATLDWARLTSLSTLANGEVANINAPAGTRVKKGAALLTLDQEVFSSQLKAAQATARNARDQRKEAKAELDRNQQMYDQTMLASHDLEVTRLAYVKADAAYQRALAELSHAQFLQQQSILHAPFNAIVLKVAVKPGEVLNNHDQSRELMVIASSDSMLARTQIDLDDALALKPGQKIKVKLDGKSLEGVISDVDLSVGNGKAKLEVTFPAEVNSDNVPGNKVDIDI